MSMNWPEPGGPEQAEILRHYRENAGAIALELARTRYERGQGAKKIRELNDKLLLIRSSVERHTR